MKHNIITLITIFCLNNLFAVINTYESSHTIMKKIDTPFESIIMDKINLEALFEEDENNIGKGIPMRYAHAFEVDFGIQNSGTWEILNDGSKIWRLGIQSPNAFGMKVLFDSFWLPEGSELHVFSKNEEMSIGPYLNEHNNADGSFGMPLVKSDHIIIEYYEPLNIKDEPKININKVFHAYVDIYGFYKNDNTRDCGDNVTCASASAYEDQSNSVIFLDMGQYICSAALINNASQDLTPYVLTAYHCIEGLTSVGQYNNFTFYFNHESSSCSGSSGYYNHSETGSYLRAYKNENSSDVALLEMADDPPSWWNPYFAGWSRSTSYPQISAGIHHPSGNAKRINFDNNDTSYGCSWYSTSTHWCLDWDDGGTAGGSSGSPIFNSAKQIVGQLSGCFIVGGNDCSDGCGGDDNAYGKFSTSWNGNNSSSRLKDWLDPNNTGLTNLDGTYDGITIIYGCTDSNACNYDSNATNNDGSCEYVIDCNGTCGGNATEDECGICNGDGSSCAGSVILSFGAINETSGTVEILMQNDVEIAGFQFAINDYPNLIDMNQVSGGSSENHGFIVSNSLEGTIVGFTLTGTTIPIGLNTLLIAFFESNNEDANVELCLSDAIFSDSNANGVSINLGSCTQINLSNSTLGDINDDGLINVLDVVILVNIILGISEINYAGDINGDGDINVLDVVVLTNMILN